MTKFTSSIGKGLSAATLDTEYQTKRRMTQKRNRPRHALYGVAVGATAFADSVTSAFEGVASKPMEGAEKGGASGFVTGIGKGMVGLFTKPAVGVFDFLSASTEGVRNTTTVFEGSDVEPTRLPRFIPSDGVLRVRLVQSVAHVRTTTNATLSARNCSRKSTPQSSSQTHSWRMSTPTTDTLRFYQMSASC